MFIKMKLKKLKQEIEIPSGIEILIEGNTVKTKGPKGENHRFFHYPKIQISKQDNKILLIAKNPSKREKTMMGTMKSHIKNLIKGVDKGFIYKLKICSGHFPMKVTVEKNNIIVNNFLGEKVPRKAKILAGVQAKIEGDEIILKGIDKELVSQSSANIELATRITNRDRRIFQDGCFITSKDGKEIR